MKMNKLVTSSSTLERFEQMLKAHDWTHVMSDDHSRYRAGVASEKKLRAFAVEIDCEAARDMWEEHAYAPSFTKGRVPMAYPTGEAPDIRDQMNTLYGG